MRRRDERLLTGLANVGQLRIGRVEAFLAFIVVLTMGLSCQKAMAQFSGPVVGLSTPVNPPTKITTDPAILFPKNRDVYLWREDLIAIHLYDHLDYGPVVRVGLDGMIQLPLIGNVQVEGLTVHEAQALVAEKLVSAGMYRDPQVSIQIMDSPNQIATVVGEIHGIVPVIGQRRLYDVLMAAGGGGGSAAATTVIVGGGGIPTSASHVITINRPGVAEPITVDIGTDPATSAAANIPIFPRDTIIVPRTGVVYLLGAFKIQGAIPFQQNAPLTLMKVAALTGGAGFEGQQSDLRIIRSVGTTRQVVRVDLKKVIDGKEPDPVLQPEDIVFLPTNQMKAAIKNGGIGTVLSIASILLIAANY